MWFCCRLPGNTPAALGMGRAGGRAGQQPGGEEIQYRSERRHKRERRRAARGGAVLRKWGGEEDHGIEENPGRGRVAGGQGTQQGIKPRRMGPRTGRKRWGGERWWSARGNCSNLLWSWASGSQM